MALNILTWNVNGLGSKIKRTLVIQYLRRHNSDIVLLQETHLQGNHCKALDRGGYKLMAHAGYTSGTRGVGILMKTAPPFILGQSWCDSQGRCIALTGYLGGQDVKHMLGIRAPKTTCGYLPGIGRGHTLIARGNPDFGGRHELSHGPRDRQAIGGSRPRG